MNLYRKYRPKNFGEIVAQDFAVQTVKNSIITRRISHAYLFSGPRGTGKTTLSKIFAKALNCLDDKSYEPCNKCKNCLDFNSGKFMDYFEIDAASNRKVEEMRDLIDKVKFVPSQGKYKVYVIDEAHMLTREASNAFLKTLEEPPSHVIFILATTEIHKILNTIQSRCQRFDFNRIAVKNIKIRLLEICKNEKISIEDEVLDYISYYAEGGMRDAINLLEQLWAFSDKKIDMDVIRSVFGTAGYDSVIDFIEKALSDNFNDILTFTDEMYRNGIDFTIFLEDLLKVLKDILYFKWNASKNDFFPWLKENIERVNRFSEKQLYSLLSSLNSEYYNLKKSEDVRLAFELLIFRQKKIKTEPQIIIKEVPADKKTSVEKIIQPEVTTPKIPDLDENTVKNAWEFVITNIAKESKFLSSCLLEAKIDFNKNDNVLNIIFKPGYNFHYSRTKKAGSIIEEHFYNVTGKKINFKYNIEKENIKKGSVEEKTETVENKPAENENVLGKEFSKIKMLNELAENFKIKSIKKIEED